VKISRKALSMFISTQLVLILFNADVMVLVLKVVKLMFLLTSPLKPVTRKVIESTKVVILSL